MGIARRRKREFERAYKKATKRQSVTPVTLRDSPGLQELVNKLTKEYEADTSSK